MTKRVGVTLNAHLYLLYINRFLASQQGSQSSLLGTFLGRVQAVNLTPGSSNYTLWMNPEYSEECLITQDKAPV
ncbi:hypothetical protein D3C84_1000620 [compost metagenome]